MVRKESITFNGIVFTRYPDSPRPELKKYYTCGSKFFKLGIFRLHREVWKSVNGEIPAGHHIHHKDGNPLNNDISNLECISGEQHRAEHRPMLVARGKSEAGRKRIAKAAEFAKIWHGSLAGRKWHRKHAKKIWENRGYVEKNCGQCGQSFRVVDLAATKAMFCSNACKSAKRRESGKDRASFKCGACGKDFIKNKFDRKKTCSRACGWIVRKATG